MPDRTESSEADFIMEVWKSGRFSVHRHMPAADLVPVLRGFADVLEAEAHDG